MSLRSHPGYRPYAAFHFAFPRAFIGFAGGSSTSADTANRAQPLHHGHAQHVGWVERSETHHSQAWTLAGFTSLNPP